MNVEQQLRNLSAIADRNQHAIHELTARVAELEKKIGNVGGTSPNIPDERGTSPVIPTGGEN